MSDPYYSDERSGIRLYHGDCLEAIADVEADVIVTDPVWPNCPANSVPGWEDPHGLFERFCAVMPDVTRAAIILRNDSDPRFLSPMPERLPFVQVMWLQYVMPGYLGRVLGGNETCYVFGEPVQSAEGRRVIPSVAPKVQPGGRKANGHPMSRAIAHMEFVVHWCSDEWETVLDPFAGSATTLRACKRLGRRGIGFEIDEGFCEIAARELDKEPRPLFEEPPAPRPEPVLFGTEE